MRLNDLLDVFIHRFWVRLSFSLCLSMPSSHEFRHPVNRFSLPCRKYSSLLQLRRTLYCAVTGMQAQFAASIVHIKVSILLWYLSAWKPDRFNSCTIFLINDSHVHTSDVPMLPPRGDPPSRCGEAYSIERWQLKNPQNTRAWILIFSRLNLDA
jgi:hypothetical protein